ncbi:hypothetical protein RJ641_023567 [Dillenia turbinata]|uniref:Uncharacterized protein n=1 Tax=Dillenia turbinata TaxID=194707 RepID=A0AAN8YQI4_9MAGN
MVRPLVKKISAFLLHTCGADIIKLVINASDITEGKRSNSQILGPEYGGFLVYGCIHGNSVPSLPTLDSLRQTYEVDCLDADIRVFGLISKPVSHGKGPILHNPTFRHVGYNGIFIPMFVDDLKEFFSVYLALTLQVSGWPTQIIIYLQLLDFLNYELINTLAFLLLFATCVPSTMIMGWNAFTVMLEFHKGAAIGAVNTIIRSRNRKLVGYNIDPEASVTAIEDARKGTDMLLIELVSVGSAISGEARFRPEKGAILADATPLGMHPNTDRIPVAEETFRDYQLVFFSIDTPRKTRLLKEAEAALAIVVSGVEMFLRQVIGQFQLFTGGEVIVYEMIVYRSVELQFVRFR